MKTITLQHHEIETKNGSFERILMLITAAFIFVNALTFSLVVEGKISATHLWGPFVWLVMMVIAQVSLSRWRPDHDRLLLPIFALLTGWGILLIDRLAVNFLARQVLWVVLGTAVLLAIAILPRNLYPLRRYRYTWLISGLILLATTLVFGVNPTGLGAKYWLPISLPLFGTIYFQPSELLKLLLAIFLASYFADRESLLRLDRQQGWRGALPYLAPLLLMWGFCMLLLVWQRDLGAATIFFILFLALLYLASGHKQYVVSGLLLLLLGGIFAYFFFSVVTLRVDAWLNPWPDAYNRAYQIVQSLYALAAGGLWGSGIGAGFPDYIPVVHSDFVFAAVAEEWGLVGSMGIVAIFMLLAYRGMRIALLTERPFRFFLAAGITILFSVQALLIMGGVTKVIPLTGVTLPFISYGGSSMLISSIMAGLLLFISADT